MDTITPNEDLEYTNLNWNISIKLYLSDYLESNNKKPFIHINHDEQYLL